MEHYNGELKEGMEGLNGNYTASNILRISFSLALKDIVEEKAYPRYGER